MTLKYTIVNRSPKSTNLSELKTQAVKDGSPAVSIVDGNGITVVIAGRRVAERICEAMNSWGDERGPGD